MQLTVGQLLDAIEKFNIPRDGKVFYQRIEDDYFEKRNWNYLPMKGECAHWLEKKRTLANGEWNNKEEYPTMTQEYIDRFKSITDEQIEELYDQYLSVSTYVIFDNKNLYITAHY